MKTWKLVSALLLSLLVVCLVTLAIIIVIWQKAKGPTTDCPTNDATIDIGESENPGIFADLNKNEIMAVRSYLESIGNFSLKFGEGASISSNFVLGIELLRPVKKQALEYLDNGGTKPERWARVILGFGAEKDPFLKEFAVGPLPNPTTHTVLKFGGKERVVPFAYRPLITQELIVLGIFVSRELDSKARKFLVDSFGATFGECGGKCLDLHLAPVPNWGNRTSSRLFICRLHYKIEDLTTHPLDLSVFVDMDTSKMHEYKIVSVMYNGQTFTNVDELAAAYKSGTIKMIRTTYPSVNQFQPKQFPDTNARPPREYTPDGARYSIRNNHVTYMLWSFDYRISTITGLQLYDVRFNNERIAYELSLQEIAVLYSGRSVVTWFADFIDSIILFGTVSRNLIAGVDCPYDATIIPLRFYATFAEKSTVWPNALCIFEHNNAIPLRRHGVVLSSMPHVSLQDYVLIIRTILTVGNYDYIFDIIFHADGTIEVRIAATGDILGVPDSTGGDDRYGFTLRDGVIGSLHQHLFNFKVDLDIKGTSNRFETLNFEPERVTKTDWTRYSSGIYNQIRMRRSLKTSELTAAYKYDFGKPKYLIFHNNQNKSKHGAPAAYRLLNNGVSKLLIPQDENNEGSLSWARYQMAVTKFKDDEPDSSSIYSFFDVKDPVVKFQDFLDDNETIVDEDLVAWVTMGLYHLPHSEDIPLTTTSAGKLSFLLQPYNFFAEDPSPGSRDSWRVELNGFTPKIVRRYRNDTGDRCVAREVKREKAVLDAYAWK